MQRRPLVAINLSYWLKSSTNSFLIVGQSWLDGVPFVIRLCKKLVKRKFLDCFDLNLSQFWGVQTWYECERYHHSVYFIRVLLLYIHHTGKNWEGSELDFRQCQTTILRLSCIKLSSCNHCHVECFCYFHGNVIQNYQNTFKALHKPIPLNSVYHTKITLLFQISCKWVSSDWGHFGSLESRRTISIGASTVFFSSRDVSSEQGSGTVNIWREIVHHAKKLTLL